MDGTPRLFMIDGWGSTRHGFNLLVVPQTEKPEHRLASANSHPGRYYQRHVRVRPGVTAVYIRWRFA